MYGGVGRGARVNGGGVRMDVWDAKSRRSSGEGGIRDN